MGYIVVKFKAGDKWHIHNVEQYREIEGLGDTSFVELTIKGGGTIHIATNEVRAIGFCEEFKNVEEHEYEW